MIMEFDEVPPYADQIKALTKAKAPAWQFAQAMLWEASNQLGQAQSSYFVNDSPFPGSNHQLKVLTNASLTLGDFGNSLVGLDNYPLLDQYQEVFNKINVHQGKEKLRDVNNARQHIVIEHAKAIQLLVKPVIGSLQELKHLPAAQNKAEPLVQKALALINEATEQLDKTIQSTRSK